MVTLRAMNYVTLCTVDNSYEANFIKDELGEEGILCMVMHETTSQIMPHLNGMLGAGVQVLVAVTDLPRAKEVVSLRSLMALSCPNCGSSNIEFGMGSQHRFKRLLMIAMSILAAVPFGNVKQLYHCSDCQAEFRK
jgi:hypothetical protein